MISDVFTTKNMRNIWHARNTYYNDLVIIQCIYVLNYHLI